MAKTFMPSVKTTAELSALQLKGLKWTVKHAYNGSPFYRRRLEEAGVKPDKAEKVMKLLESKRDTVLHGS